MRSKIIRLPPMRHCIEKHNNILALKCSSKKYYRHRVRNRDRSEHYGIRLANKNQRKINEKQKKNYRRWTTIITSESSVYNLVHRPSTIEKCSLSHKLLANVCETCTFWANIWHFNGPAISLGMCVPFHLHHTPSYSPIKIGFACILCEWSEKRLYSINLHQHVEDWIIFCLQWSVERYNLCTAPYGWI